ncbi:hypothetical protein BDR06DRAFT_969779 [Suillus hirtellus]|nr:hypothetical protein BDR06DRAFT_969779 [Suillus hirtellus]
MSHDSCALNSDGSLKDASDIVPPQNAFTTLLQSGCTPALTVAGSQHSTRTSRPSTHVRDANNVSSSTRKRMLSSATDPPAKKAAAMHFLSPLDTDEEDEDEGNNPSSPPIQEGSFYEEFVPHPDDNDDNDEAKSGNGDDASQMTVSKSERTVDLHTIFTHTSDGWVCNLCNLTEQLATLEDDPEAITEDGFDVGDAIRKALALIEQIRKSPQAHTFLKKSCEEEGIPVHEILAWVRTHWASLFKCLEHFMSLHLAINHFILLADKSPKVPMLHNKAYSDFKLDWTDWKKIQLEPTTAQQSFSSATHPTASQTIPTLECHADMWQTMANSIEYSPITDAIQKGLKNMGKYYKKTNDSDIYFICLVLDPNYKLAYVESHWSAEKVMSGRVGLQALFNKYYEAPPMSCTMDAAVPTKVLQGVRYGQSWMRDAVTAHQAADNHMHDLLQELSSYLTSPLEETDNIVAWWGICFSFYTHFSIPHYLAFGGITSTLCRNALAPATFSALQLLKAGYRNGHVSAATEAEEFAAIKKFSSVQVQTRKKWTGPQRMVLNGLVLGLKILQNWTMVQFLVLILDPLNWTELNCGSTRHISRITP